MGNVGLFFTESARILLATYSDLDCVIRIVKVLGMVNSTEDFTDQSKVMNGFSNFMVKYLVKRDKMCGKQLEWHHYLRHTS